MARKYLCFPLEMTVWPTTESGILSGLFFSQNTIPSFDFNAVEILTQKYNASMEFKLNTYRCMKSQFPARVKLVFAIVFVRHNMTRQKCAKNLQFLIYFKEFLSIFSIFKSIFQSIFQSISHSIF